MKKITAYANCSPPTKKKHIHSYVRNGSVTERAKVEAEECARQKSKQSQHTTPGPSSSWLWTSLTRNTNTQIHTHITCETDRKQYRINLGSLYIGQMKHFFWLFQANWYDFSVWQTEFSLCIAAYRIGCVVLCWIMFCVWFEFVVVVVVFSSERTRNSTLIVNQLQP